MRRLTPLLACALITGCAFIDDFGKFEVDPAGADAGDAGRQPDTGPPPPDSGRCGPETCNGEDDDCDGTTDEEPTECSFPNAVVGCVAGACEMTGCVDGFGDCSAEAGCETALSTSTNCGACGTTCGWGEACFDAACGQPPIAEALAIPSNMRSSIDEVVWEGDTRWVTFTFQGNANVFGRDLSSPRFTAGVLQLNPDDSVAWLELLDASGSSGVVGLERNPTGELYVAGSFAGTVTVGGTVYDASPARFAAYLWSLGSDGSARWFEAYPSTDSVSPSALALADGTLTLVGSATGDFGALPNGGGDDAFVLRRDDSPTSLSLRYSGGSGSDRLRDAAIAADGSFAIVGGAEGPATIIGATVSDPPTDGQQAFLGWNDDLDSSRWSVTTGNDAPDLAQTVAMDPSGNIYWTAQVGGDFDFGGGDTVAAAPFPTVIGSHTSAGVLRWTTQLRNVTPTSQVSTAERVFVLGTFTDGDISEDGRVSHSGDRDGILVALDASTGGVVWVRTWGGVGRETASSVMLDPAGGVWVTGGSDAPVMLETLYEPQGSDGYLFRVSN